MVNMFLGPVKALVEKACGDDEGADRTMEEFTKTNPIAVVARLGVDVVLDDKDDAKETVEAFGKNIVNIANSTPVLGHGIALGHAIAGDQEKAEQIYLQATRTTAVAAAGVVGAAAGPIGAIGLAAEAGTCWDCVEAAAGGRVNGVPKIIDAISNDKELPPGEVFDAVMVPVGDGMTGLAAAELYDKILKANAKNQARQQVQQENDVKIEPLEKRIVEADQNVDNPRELAENMSKKADLLKEQTTEYEPKLRELQTGRTRNDYHMNGHVSCTMIDESGNEATGYNSRLTNASETKRFVGDRSKLHNTYPSIESVNGRYLDNCAEHMAYETCSNPTLTYALKIDNGIVKCVERCANCKQFPLGTVITDFMDGQSVPFELAEVPPPGSYIGPAVYGTVLVTVQDRRKIDKN